MKSIGHSDVHITVLSLLILQWINNFTNLKRDYLVIKCYTVQFLIEFNGRDSTLCTSLSAFLAHFTNSGAQCFIVASDCKHVGYKFADERNRCWYHECVLNGDDRMATIPRACALGSASDDYFVAGDRNPCTVNFDSAYGTLSIIAGSQRAW